ncbi:hypothetical protein J2Z53_000047 [Clostridium moniliforme]|uniref:DUF4317 domain-containing protein n=1 Tax=Clostridium moniliforme TaxID=39489 RepID=A0ABS4EWU1_9CLOT|nr:DUF4317 domain-containing protein [Clostridium moniliforme]MBP1888468.1 hypothetical protein [Clostridium moniliforme]
MRKKDILELKKRFKKDYCTFSKMCGCYVNGEKKIILKFKETFLNLDEDEYFKYLELAKKVLSGTISNNILELKFPLNEDLINEKQVSLMKLKSSQFKDDTLLDDFYKSIIDNYDYTGNFLILLFNDSYDILTKTSDNNKIDESEEVYEYILCAICPVELSKPGLRYFEEENTIKARIRDWVVKPPVNGFVFPAFIDRSSDVNSIMYYTKNAKDPHPELMEGALGCYSKQTATIQKETFKSIVKDSFGADEKLADKVFMDIQENLNNFVEEYNDMYSDTDCDPITLKDKDIQNILIESGVSKELTTKIEKSYIENFGDDIPLVENLIDSKILKANEQRKKEENLKNQVKALKTRLEEVTKETSSDKEITLTKINENNIPLEENLKDSIEEHLENNEELSTESSNEILEANDENTNEISVSSEITSEYDVVLQVKPEKVPQIKSQVIDGQKCIVIPINDDEQAKVNGLDDLI